MPGLPGPKGHKVCFKLDIFDAFKRLHFCYNSGSTSCVLFFIISGRYGTSGSGRRKGRTRRKGKNDKKVIKWIL